MVKASIVTVKCLVCTCEKHLPPELYLLNHKAAINQPVSKPNQTKNKKTGSQSRNRCQAYVLEELVEHVVGYLFGSVAVELEYLLPLGVEGVEGAELALAVAEEDQEVLALVPGDLLEHALLGLPVDDAREDAVLHRVQNNRTV